MLAAVSLTDDATIEPKAMQDRRKGMLHGLELNVEDASKDMPLQECQTMDL